MTEQTKKLFQYFKHKLLLTNKSNIQFNHPIHLQRFKASTITILLLILAFADAPAVDAIC